MELIASTKTSLAHLIRGARASDDHRLHQCREWNGEEHTASQMPPGENRGDNRQSDKSVAHDFNDVAYRETEGLIGPPLIDRDFDEPVRILVPEGAARRDSGEGTSRSK